MRCGGGGGAFAGIAGGMTTAPVGPSYRTDFFFGRPRGLLGAQGSFQGMSNHLGEGLLARLVSS